MANPKLTEQLSLSLPAQSVTTKPRLARVRSALDSATAVPALAGFVYQVQRAICALFELREGQTLGVEVLDDHHVEDGTGARRLDQLKLHRPGAVLTDRSPDLWRTLGTWASAIADGSLDLGTVEEVRILTTATVPEGSLAAAILLKTCPEDIADRLLSVPKSRAAKLRRSFDAVHALKRPRLVDLVRRLRIEASGPTLGDVEELLRVSLRSAGFADATIPEARRDLVGWFESVLVQALAANRGLLVTEGEFHAALVNIRDRYPQDALPARFSKADVPSSEYAGLAEELFVRQLRLVDAAPDTIKRAIRDYFRAVRERTTWVARNELLPDQIENYDDELVSRWEPLYEECCDRAAGVDDNRTLARYGLEHYRQVQRLEYPIDHRWPYLYLMLGSYHRLANIPRLGWHPQYVHRIAAQDSHSTAAGNPDLEGEDEEAAGAERLEEGACG